MRFNSKVELTKWAKDSTCLWLFLDYDGTLEEFAPTPFDIHPNPAIIRILEKLASKSNIRVTIISGRNLKYVRQLIPVRGIFLAGSYGIEILTPTRETIHRLDFDFIRPMLETIKPQWSRLIRGKRGFFLEDKGWTLAIHARFADEMETEQVINDARSADGIDSFSQHFRILGGHKFIEIAPQLATKQEAVVHLLQAYPFENAHLLYIGDDDKDEQAFPVIHANGGVAIKVLQPSQMLRPTEADVGFSNPSETLDWLSTLI